MNEILDKNNVRAKEEYEKFVLSHKNGNFMQSLHWTGVKKDWDYEAVISDRKSVVRERVYPLV